MSLELVVIAYVLVVVALALYAVHAGVLLLLSFRRHPQKSRVEALSELPRVTVQIPIYNERYVVERVILAASELDYPRDRLQIQVLDDSTDDTWVIARRAVDAARSRGVRIELLHREERIGYKAGALQDALASAEGELIAVFDADFVPRQDFLRRVIGELRVFEDSRVGFAQTRWTFMNRSESILTRTQGLLLDKHFLVEQPARSGSGLLFNFNGSGGIWRRTCLEDAGGWQADTLTEDLDLSYRAQMKGWRGVYCEQETSPSDLPDTVTAFKRQQRRWARGSAQCLRKLLPRILRAPLTWSQKIAAAMQLGGYVCQLFVLAFILLWPIVAMSETGAPPWLRWSSAAAVAVIASFFAAHQKRSDSSVGQFVRDFPAALALAIGVSFSNSIAVLRGLVSRRSGEFERTPKRSADHSGGYALRPDWTMWVEFALAGYALVAFALMYRHGDLWLALPMLFYALAFAAVASSQASGLFTPGDLTMREPLPDDP